MNVEYLVGSALGVGLLAIGFLIGFFVNIRITPVHPKENGMSSALILFKQTADKVIGEAASSRTCMDGIIGDLLKTNGLLCDKVLACTDGALERMRIERPEPQIPIAFPSQQPRIDNPDMVIPDRLNDPHG